VDNLNAAILALVQGFTEFLPISSAGHLILFPQLFGWPDQGLAFDVSVHVGSLMAVLLYFRHDVRLMLRDWFAHVTGRGATAESRLAWAVLFGTIPAGLAGLVFQGLIEGELRGPLTIATTTILFGLVLWYADVSGRRRRDEHTLSWKDVLFIGCAQALALVPGTSRSGITMTAGLMLGLTREAAARFSFLLSIPIIVLAGGLNTVELLQSDHHLPWAFLATGTAIACVSAYLCIHFFLKLIERISMLPFVVYRLLLGAVLLYLFL
jgi:undecaprenyl-diphosphatase